jgi:hypothetical protein
MESIKELYILSNTPIQPGSPKKPDTPKRKQLKRLFKRSRLKNKFESPAIKSIERTIVSKHTVSDEFSLTI